MIELATPTILRPRKKRLLAPLGISTGFSSTASSTWLPWQPTQISGCALWLRADKGITLNSTTVSAWADQSGSGDTNKNASQATAGLQPTYNSSDSTYNHHPTMTFSGSCLLRTGVWATAVPQTFTIFVVGNTDDSAVSNHYFYDNVSGSQCAMFDPNNGASIYAGAQHAFGVPTLNTPSILWGVVDNVSTYGAVNSSTGGASSNAGFNGFTGMTIGNYLGGGGFALHGPLAEIIVWNRGLSGTEISTVFSHLSSYYAIA